jgi:thiamine pyrophosphate-dependent acetolactate synthase large subunit-like protein
MYTLQALWTQAWESLDVATLIFANHSYAIPNIELARVGAGKPGFKAVSLLDLHDPVLDWVKLASGMGVEANRAISVEDFAAQFESAMKTRGSLRHVATPRRHVRGDRSDQGAIQLFHYGRIRWSPNPHRRYLCVRWC